MLFESKINFSSQVLLNYLHLLFSRFLYSVKSISKYDSSRVFSILANLYIL